jgi:hypothetical protein
MMAARRMVRRNFGSDHHNMLRILAKVLVTIVWPGAVLVNLAEAHRMLPREVSLRRATGALRAAIRHNVLPTEYFAYGLWRRECRQNIDNYLYANEAARLFKVINRPRVPDPIGDKLAFHAMCTAHGLPTPAVLAAFSPTGLLQNFPSGGPPQRHLFVKSASRGFHERLLWCGADFHSNRGYRIQANGLASYLADRARLANVTLVVQPTLLNHPNLQLESCEALATVRLVTGRTIHGQVIPIFSYISFGLPHEITAHSNHVTLIDIATGRLLPPPRNNNPAWSMCEYRHLGDSCELAGWDAALGFATVAHTSCSNVVYIGWDLAFTEKGPVLLEGNANWDSATFQMLQDQPLGLTKFVDVLAQRVDLK